MTDPDPNTGFTLSYSITADDLKEVLTRNPALRRRRARLIPGLVAWALLALLFTAAAVTQAQRSGQLSPADGLLLILWLPILGIVAVLLRLSPQRLARTALRKQQRLHGRHTIKVGSDGVTTIEPDGSQGFSPWTTIDRIHETGQAFHLFDIDGRMRARLPKRGLGNPDLIPALRDFVHRSVDDQVNGRSNAG